MFGWVKYDIIYETSLQNKLSNIAHEDTQGVMPTDKWPCIRSQLQRTAPLSSLYSNITPWLTYTCPHTPTSLFLSIIKIVIPNFKLGFTLMNVEKSMGGKKKKKEKNWASRNQHKDGDEEKNWRQRGRHRGGEWGSASWCQWLIKFMPSCHFPESKQALQPNMTSLSRLSVVPRGHRSSQNLAYSGPH